MKYYRVGVHTLVDLLYSPENLIKKGYQKQPEGVTIHLKLGYVGSETFKKYYITGDYLFEIVGSPDKIDRREGCVEELKTYSNERSKEIQKERGRLQLIFYSFLTGLNCAKLVLYGTTDNKIETIQYSFTEREIKETIEKALQKYIKLREAIK
jgi:hypothetical protein